MKCSKCGGEIKNLPDYIAETQTETLCSKCAGYSEQGESSIYSFGRYRSHSKFTEVSDDMEVAA